MQDEFVLANSNETRLTYRLSIDEDVDGAFMFLVEDTETTRSACSGWRNQAEFVLEAKQQIRVCARFRRVKCDAQLITGSIRIAIRECESKQAFCVQLVAFQFEVDLAVIDSRPALDKK